MATFSGGVPANQWSHVMLQRQSGVHSLYKDGVLQGTSTINANFTSTVIRLGSKGGSASANTNIRATVAGTVLEIPVEKGDQVIASNSFNAGTTVATIADLNKMIFEGKVDEAEVGKLNNVMPLEVNLGAGVD